MAGSEEEVEKEQAEGETLVRVMTGLVPAIHVFLDYARSQDVDARVKPAHDR